MAKGGEVLEMLIPSGGWVISGDDFDSIRYDDGVKPITKKQFQDAFAEVDAWKAKEEAARATRKTEILTRLGITDEEAKIVLA
jgi:hypothetical protein